MPNIPALILTPIQAANFVDQTMGLARLEPILIRGGPFKDRYMLPARSKYDPEHASKLMALTLLTEIVLDTDVAFPPEPE